MRLNAFAGLLDDAAVFPPGPTATGGAPLDAALPAHRGHRAAWYSPLVGPFVFPANRISELSDLHNDVPLHVALTATGRDGLRNALEALALPAVRLVSVELVPDGEDPIPLLDDHLPAEVTGYVEVPRGPDRDAVLDRLAGTRYRAKFRTGGLVPKAHPSEAELAGSILAATGRGVPFKCTAGLHHAIRHTAPAAERPREGNPREGNPREGNPREGNPREGDPGQGGRREGDPREGDPRQGDPREGELEQHGFLNVLLATAAALDGARAPDLAALLAERDAHTVAARIQALGETGVARARERFVSFGTCSIDDPVRDLTDLKLIDG